MIFTLAAYSNDFEYAANYCVTEKKDFKSLEVFFRGVNRIRTGG